MKPVRPSDLLQLLAKRSERLRAISGFWELEYKDGTFWVRIPLDERVAGVNLGEAVQDPSMARALAMFLVPEDRHSTCPFFADAARELLYVVVVALNATAGRHWNLNDLFRALDSADSIAETTAVLPIASKLRAGFLEDTRYLPSILSTLFCKLEPVKMAVALHGATCVSLVLLAGILNGGRRD